MKEQWSIHNKGKLIASLQSIRRIAPLDDKSKPFEYEYTLAGKYGEIWENNLDTCKVLCKGAKIRNKLKNHQNLAIFLGSWKDARLSVDDEFVIIIPNEYVNIMAKILKISSPGRQLKYV